MQNFQVAEGFNAYELSNDNWHSDSKRKVNREIWISKKITAACCAQSFTIDKKMKIVFLWNF